MIGGEGNSTTSARMLLDRFLANRPERTVQAYTTDLRDFARFLNRAPDAAVAEFLSDGPRAGSRLVLDYAVDLRRRGRASATINRRLGTLCTLTRVAHNLRMIEWLLDIPSPNKVSAAVEQRSASDSVHYLLSR